MLAPGFLDLFFDAAPYLEYVFQFFELSTKAAFAKVAFDTQNYRGKKSKKNTYLDTTFLVAPLTSWMLYYLCFSPIDRLVLNRLGGSTAR